MRDWAGVDHAPCEGDPRIACLVPSITELLFALGLGPFVVARTGFCIHPAPAVQSVPKVGGTKDVQVEKLLSTHPTYLIVNIDENRKDVIETIQRTAPNLRLIVTHPVSPEDNATLYELLGKIFRVEPRANELKAALFRTLQRTRDAVHSWPVEDVLYLIWSDPWMTVSPDTYIARTLETVGWKCAQPNQRPESQPLRYPIVLSDDPVWRQVDRVLLSNEPYAFKKEHFEAVQKCAPQAHLHHIDGEHTSWYGVRAIEGIGALLAARMAVTNVDRRAN